MSRDDTRDFCDMSFSLVLHESLSSARPGPSPSASTWKTRKGSSRTTPPKPQDFIDSIVPWEMDTLDNNGEDRDRALLSEWLDRRFPPRRAASRYPCLSFSWMIGETGITVS
ncbi:hypothetical protein POX_e07061 [Penicillium oxalicum]|uniref:hypothetical protein n=1 Tax=Penicillium oxalicum TaxID=69781 RepID=UPI0020B6A110|nr:hypothetical protein POX_e07061 [Penicillium oxalicum]KAI2789035.1 hypothetical protein POX_e07061 [Penicillium oxalicum]